MAEGGKDVKVFTKELETTYKSWAALIKSKDVQQLSLLTQQHIQDDAFMLGGGGLVGFIKACGSKVSEDRGPNSSAMPAAAALFQLKNSSHTSSVHPVLPLIAGC